MNLISTLKMTCFLFVFSADVLLVMEFVENGSLKDFVKSRPRLSNARIGKFCLDVAKVYTAIASHLLVTEERDVALWQECSLIVRWVVGSILHGVDPLSYFSFQPVLHNWCSKGCGMCYPVYGMVHIKEPLLLIGNSSPCGGSRFPCSLSEWSFTICPTPYNRKQNVLRALLNKTFPSLFTLVSY